jgi:hypothetical protein
VLQPTCSLSIAIAPPFAGLRRFPDGRGFKQWTGDDSKALMKVRFARLSRKSQTPELFFDSFICPLCKAIFRLMSCARFDHSSNFTILHAMISLPRTIWRSYKMLYQVSISIDKYSHLCAVKKAFRSLDNTLWYIIQHLSFFLEHLMVSVLRLLNQNTSVRLRSPGVVRIAINLFFRCSQPISVLTSLLPRVRTLLCEGCSTEP